MSVALNAGFNSLLRNRSHRVLPLKTSPFVLNISLNSSRRLLLRRRLVLSCVDKNDNSSTTTSIDSPPSSNSSKPVSESVESVKKAPLTARERLRAARVLSRYTEATPPKPPKMGSQLLDVLKESDKKSKRKPGLPEDPTNMLDDSKRGMPKSGLTFDLPGASDILIIAFSFVFISSVMFATTFFVWKLGAIHFNE